MSDGVGGSRGPLSIWMWAAGTAVLAAVAYLTGSALAFRSPGPQDVYSAGATQVPGQDVAPLAVGRPVEGSLGSGADQTWQFDGRAGQSLTIETWLHPGSGSNVDAELQVQLLAPDGTLLAQESGSVFLPPYVVHSSLPADGSYRVQVMPASGVPGRYSLVLALGDPVASVGTGGTPYPEVISTVPVDGSVTAAEGRFQWPSTRRDISGWTFHDPRNPSHIGLDIAASMWDPIVSIADGIVIFAEWGGGYGNLVIVEHDEGWVSYYAHLTEIVVKVGQSVRQGELLGGAGTTGYSTGPHLHFEIRYQGRPVDPHVYLP